MADMISQSESDNRYAKKGIGNAGLALGIVGTALGAWALHRGAGLFGLGAEPVVAGATAGVVARGGLAACGGPTAWETYQKETADDLALTRAIYDMRIKDLEEKQGIYNYFNGKFCEVDKRVTAIEAAKPYEAKILELTFQLERSYTNEKFVEAMNYTNRLDCRNIKGEVVLPSTPTVTGYGSYYPPCTPCR